MTIEGNNIQDFTAAQWAALAWTPRASGLLSICGSTVIIRTILLGGKDKLSKLHNRLLFAMSVFDIINSLALGSSTAPFPSDEDPTNEITQGGYGNKTTCSIYGFRFQIA